MVICVVDCKSNSRQGKTYIFINFQGTKICNREEMKKCRNVEISSPYNMLECVMFIASAKILAGKRCDFS